MKKLLPIKYDRSFPIASFGDDTSAYTILSDYFKNYIQITELQNTWTKEFSSKVLTHELGLRQRSKNYVETLTREEFSEYARAIPDYYFVIHAPVSPPYKINPLRFIMNSPALSHAYENKRYFRDEFAGIIRVPEYKTVKLQELTGNNSYSQLESVFGEKFVIQDEESAGSTGTFIIKSSKDYSNAVQELKRNSSSKSLVISKYQVGESTSIQVCITKYGILISGIQQQLVGSSYLSNQFIAGANKWCGGDIGKEYPKDVIKQAKEIGMTIGAELSANGYKGIFGVDLIISPNNEVFAIEINARLTGYTHIVSEMQQRSGKIPFLLLHVLELSDIPYKITDLDALPTLTNFTEPLSYLIVMNTSRKKIKLKNDIKSGIYHLVNGAPSFMKSSNSISDIKKQDQFLLESTIYSKGDSIGPGSRILKIFRPRFSMESDELNKESQALISAVKQHFDLP